MSMSMYTYLYLYIYSTIGVSWRSPFLFFLRRASAPSLEQKQKSWPHVDSNGCRLSLRWGPWDPAEETLGYFSDFVLWELLLVICLPWSPHCSHDHNQATTTKAEREQIWREVIYIYRMDFLFLAQLYFNLGTLDETLIWELLFHIKHL